MARIVVIGSVALDMAVRLDGRVREGCHLSGRDGGVRLGGGGANTAAALAAAGHRVTLVSAVGDDALGDDLLARLRAAGVETSAVVRVPGPSTRSILLVDPAGERTIVNLGRATEPEAPRRLLDIPADLIYVRTRQLGLAPLLAEAGRRTRVVAHVPPLAPGQFPAQVLVSSASDMEPAFLADPFASGATVAGPGLEWVVVTRGADGAEALGCDGRRLTVPAPHARGVDSTGAGDAFAAGLLHAMAGGYDMAAALAEGCRWGAEKVRHSGSILPAEAVRALLAPAVGR